MCMCIFVLFTRDLHIDTSTSTFPRYLHEVCSPSVVHQNFKSENILLDTELNPHLSDCGLASLHPNGNQVKFHIFQSGKVHTKLFA